MGVKGEEGKEEEEEGREKKNRDKIQPNLAILSIQQSIAIVFLTVLYQRHYC